MITNCPDHLPLGQTRTLFGSQLNGLSQAVSYGDDLQAATNYPLVRLTNRATGEVHYLRTHDHSNMGVAPGRHSSTNFDIRGVDPGEYELEVVANGIPSASVPVTVDPYPTSGHLRHYDLWQRLIGSLADGELFVLRGNRPVPVGPIGPEDAARVIELLLSESPTREQQIYGGSDLRAPTEIPRGQTDAIGGTGLSSFRAAYDRGRAAALTRRLPLAGGRHALRPHNPFGR